MTAALPLLAITACFAASLVIYMITARCVLKCFHRERKASRRRRIVRCR